MMDREEQIKKQADIYTDDASNYTEWSDDWGWSATNDIELVEKAFIEGAKWADANPKSPWISVKEDLPNNPKYLKQSDDSPWVLAITENGEILFAQMIVMNGRWIWHSHFNWKHEDIKYWMPIISSLPKEYESIWEIKLCTIH